jgi:hypothetical protein
MLSPRCFLNRTSFSVIAISHKNWIAGSTWLEDRAVEVAAAPGRRARLVDRVDGEHGAVARPPAA